MAAELLRTLVSLTLVSSTAILLVLALRRPLRAWAGARASYWLWLVVPVLALASLLPLPAQSFQMSTESLPAQVRSALTAVEQTVLSADAPSFPVTLLSIWLFGASVMCVIMVVRQRSFTRSLGALIPETSDILRSNAVSAPMVVGAWKPRIIVPQDFESRYSPEERELVLAHERAHLIRHDVASNALASAALCLFWFNPLLYFALGWMRADQELACDARVLLYRQHAARAYANALLKTQLATESTWRMPVGCQWQSTHPLKERIAMLKQPLPRKRRHLSGIASVIVLAGGGGYVAWAGQGAVSADGPSILVSIKLTVSDPRTNEMFNLVTQYVVHSGEVPAGMLDKQPLAFACKPYLPDDPRVKKWFQNEPVTYQAIYVECEVWDKGQRVFTPSVLTEDGRYAVLEYMGKHAEDAESRRYKLEISASTSGIDLEAAKAAADIR